MLAGRTAGKAAEPAASPPSSSPKPAGRPGRAGRPEVVDLETARPVGVLDWPALHEALPATTSLTVTLVGDLTTDVLVLMRTPDGGRLLRAAADGTVLLTVEDWEGPELLGQCVVFMNDGAVEDVETPLGRGTPPRRPWCRPGQAGAANVLPVAAARDSSPGVWLSVRDDGGLQGPLD